MDVKILHKGVATVEYYHPFSDEAEKYYSEMVKMLYDQFSFR